MVDIMPIDTIADWEQRLARQDAFWERQIIDRPPISIAIPKKDSTYPMPAAKNWNNPREQWLDTQYYAEWALASTLNTEFLGDALPKFIPKLGPDIFTAFLGAELEYNDSNSWSSPILNSLDDIDKVVLRQDGFYWSKIIEITRALLEIGKGKFYTGLIDFHTGGDCLAALRGPIDLSLDLVERPEDVKQLLDRVTRIYLHAFDYFYDMLHAQGQACTTWMNFLSTRKWYPPCNDYSCMISAEMFKDVFIPGIRQECQHTENSIYHLDGTTALQHLDNLLDIPELKAVQWVQGAGHGRATDWLPVYKRCQTAKKGIWVHLHVSELDVFMENLKPEGVFMVMGGIKDKEHAESVLKKVATWR